jgi:hypothetical protein
LGEALLIKGKKKKKKWGGLNDEKTVLLKVQVRRHGRWRET